MSDTFTCAVDGVSACSRAPAPCILVDSRTWHAVVALCERFSTEWLAYLIGEKDAVGNYVIKSLSFPEQTAGGAHVRNSDNPEFRVEAGTIGAIHSHVRMQAFFSSTDVAHANWPVEIVVNAKGEYETSVRVTLPCGENMRRKAVIVLLTDGQLDRMETSLKEALEKGKANQAKDAQTRVVWPMSHGYGSYGYHEGNGAFDAAKQDDDMRLLGNKYFNCPICGNRAIGCPHSISDMDKHESAKGAQA